MLLNFKYKEKKLKLLYKVGKIWGGRGEEVLFNLKGVALL